MARARLILAYNADAGIIAALFDSVHKLVSPSTYPCALCAVTYGAVSMDRRWRAWLDALPLPVTFHHRPDFRAAFPSLAGEALPLVALDDCTVQVLLDARALASISSVEALIAAVEARLNPP